MGSDLSTSCILSDEPHLPNETPIIKSPLAPTLPKGELMTVFPDFPTVYTIYDLLEQTRERMPDYPFYGKRMFRNGRWLDQFEFVSRNEFCRTRDIVGSYMKRNIINDNNHIGILSYNRMEWVYVQHACYAYGFIPVPIYDTFGWENMNYIINHASLTHIFIISTKIKDLLSHIEESCCLTDLIVIDAEESPFDPSLYPDSKVRFHRFSECLSERTILPHTPPTTESTAFIMYTSGTTGNPKGCVLKQGAFISAAAGIETHVYPFSPKDSMLSYLPLAHVLEQTLNMVGIKIFAKMAFYSGNTSRLIEEFSIFKPTIVTGVARVFERITAAIKTKIEAKPLVTRALFNGIISFKSFLLKQMSIKNVPGLDKVFDPVRKALGGNCQLLVCGGSALPPETQHWLRIVLNSYFENGYGLTETTAGSIVQRYVDYTDGNCGNILACTEGKLRDVEELGYYASNMQGELLLRGPTIFKGYYKDPQATADAVDSEGWLSTGDVFELTKDKRMKMIARKKEIIKLSQGEYVSLQKLSSVYSQSKYVKQIYVHAGLHSRFLVAVVVPDNATVPKATIIESLNETAKQQSLLGFERIRDIILTNEEFTTENGMMTPSQKQCRKKIEDKFKAQIESITNI